MRKNLLSVISLFLLITSAQAQVNIQWASRFTGTGNNTDKAEDIAIASNGDVYICGTTWSGTTFDYLTVKYNSAGVQQWSRTYNGGGNSIDEARALAVDANGNVYVTGASYFTAGNDDYVTIKYDAAGTQQWIKNYNGPAGTTDEAWDIALDNAGNVFVTGGSTGSGTGEDYATLKYDPANGNQLALVRYTFSGSNIDKAQSIAIDAAGNVYVTGYSFGSAALDLDYATLKYTNALVAVWGTASRYNGTGSGIDQAKKISVSTAGNVYVTGYSNNTYVLDDDITTVMYNAAGLQQWVSRYGAGNNVGDRSYSVTCDAVGNSYVVGMIKNTSTNQDMVTIKYSITGVQQWATEYNGPSNGWDEARDCVLEPTGTYIYVSGFSQNPGTNQDVTTVKYATIDGSQQWLTKYSFTGNNVDQGYAIALDANENVYVSGQSSGGTTSGNDALTIKYCQLSANAGSDVAICQNASTTLNASATNATAYSWAPSTGLSSTTINNPVANPTVTTTYTVTITNSSGCTDIDSVTVTVFLLPSTPITANGPTTFCQGGSVQLCAATYNSYSWTPGGQTTQCITVNVSNTAYTCYVTDTNTCAAQSSIGVQVDPLPIANAGNDTSVCLSQNVQLNATGGATYSWSPGGTLSNTTSSNPQAGPVTTTTYTVIVTSSAGCSSVDSVKVTVVGNPPVPSLTYNFDTLCASSATCYQWYQSPNILMTGETGQCLVVPANGTYYVVVCNSNGCTTASATFTVNNIGMGEIDNFFGSSVYPNPNTGNFTLELNLGIEQDITLRIMSVTGEVVLTDMLENASGTVKKDLDLSGMAKGMYFIQMISDEGSAVRRVIIN